MMPKRKEKKIDTCKNSTHTGNSVFITLMTWYHECLFPGEVHQMVLDLEGMGGGGKIQLEVRL